MKFMRNQLKYRLDVQVPMLLWKVLKIAGIQFFMLLQKEQYSDNKQKIN